MKIHNRIQIRNSITANHCRRVLPGKCHPASSTLTSSTKAPNRAASVDNQTGLKSVQIVADKRR